MRGNGLSCRNRQHYFAADLPNSRSGRRTARGRSSFRRCGISSLGFRRLSGQSARSDGGSYRESVSYPTSIGHRPPHRDIGRFSAKCDDARTVGALSLLPLFDLSHLLAKGQRTSRAMNSNLLFHRIHLGMRQLKSGFKSSEAAHLRLMRWKAWELRLNGLFIRYFGEPREKRSQQRKHIHSEV